MASVRDKAFIFDTECTEGAVCVDIVYNQKIAKKISKTNLLFAKSLSLLFSVGICHLKCVLMYGT